MPMDETPPNPAGDVSTDSPLTTADQIQTDQAPPKKKLPWRQWIAAAENNRRRLLDGWWRTNVDYRVQQPFGGIGDSDQTYDRIAVPEDWSRTKQKTAQLMFKVPKILATATRPEWRQAEGVVTAAVNQVLKDQCHASYMVDEVLADVINAAGLMISVIGIDVRTEDYQVPGPAVQQFDPVTQAMTMAPGPMATMQRKTYQRITWDRVSPALFLWPVEFTKSHWAEAPWLGYEVYLPLEAAKKRFNLPPDFEASSRRPKLLSADIEEGTLQHKDTTETVKVTVIWYYTANYDPTINNPQHISRIVFVEGMDEPVSDGPTDWQEWIPEQPEVPSMPAVPGQPPPPPPKPAVPGHFRGITSLPIRVGTLAYISDLAIPPSDSQAGRPQVREMIRSRSQMLRQRDHSVPVRWYDVNRLDELVADKLRSGEWQDMIPVQGPGDRVIGEVARASFPKENFQFQTIISNDLDQAWALSSNQLGSVNPTTRSKFEVQTVETATQTRLLYEKERVNRYVAEGAEVVWGLMQRFFDQPMYVELIGQDGAAMLQQLDVAARTGCYTFDFLTDSSDRVDITARQATLQKMYNLMANSPNTRRIELEKEIWRTNGLDPAKFVVEQPPAPPPEKPNVSYRFNGADLLNPMAVAILQKSGTPVTPEDIKAAVLMIRDATQLMSGVQPLPPPPGVTPGNAVPPLTAPPPVTPPETPEPILKRAVDGTHLT